MRTSEKLENLMKDYLRAQEEIHNIAPNKKGYGYNYVDLAMIIDKSKPALMKNNLLIIQSVGGEIEDRVSITTRLQHISGEFIEDTFSLPLTAMKSVNNVQAMGASITYGKRYGLGAILGIATDEDVDGKIQHHNKIAKEQTAKEPYNIDRAIKKLEGCKDPGSLIKLWSQLSKEFDGTIEERKELVKYKDIRKKELGL